MNDSTLIEENQKLKSTIKKLVSEKAAWEYHLYKSFAKLLNAKKKRIQELEAKIQSLQIGNARSCRGKKRIVVGGKRQSSDEEQCSQANYGQDADIGEIDENEEFKSITEVSTKKFNAEVLPSHITATNVPVAVDSNNVSGSENELSQSGSQENNSQYLLRPYANTPLKRVENSTDESNPSNSSTEDSKRPSSVGAGSQKQSQNRNENSEDVNAFDDLMGNL